MEKILLNAEEIARTLERLAYEVLERHGDCHNLAIVGIQRRGVNVAMRLQKILQSRLNKTLPLGTLDINLYRDDWTSLESQPMIHQTSLPFTVDGSKILLIDDVLYSGRTVRSALEAVLDYGRPERVELLVLVDRGHRELPIQPDYAGKRLNTRRTEQVNVFMQEEDGKDVVVLVQKDEA